jgi:hypothetical protein
VDPQTGQGKEVRFCSDSNSLPGRRPSPPGLTGR